MFSDALMTGGILLLGFKKKERRRSKNKQIKFWVGYFRHYDYQFDLISLASLWKCLLLKLCQPFSIFSPISQHFTVSTSIWTTFYIIFLTLEYQRVVHWLIKQERRKVIFTSKNHKEFSTAIGVVLTEGTVTKVTKSSLSVNNHKCHVKI